MRNNRKRENQYKWDIICVLLVRRVVPVHPDFIESIITAAVDYRKEIIQYKYNY